MISLRSYKPISDEEQLQQQQQQQHQLHQSNNLQASDHQGKILNLNEHQHQHANNNNTNMMPTIMDDSLYRDDARPTKVTKSKNRQRRPAVAANNNNNNNVDDDSSSQQSQQGSTAGAITTIEVVANSKQNYDHHHHDLHLHHHHHHHRQRKLDADSSISVVVVSNNNNNNNSSSKKDYHQAIGHVNHGYSSDNDNNYNDDALSSEIEEDSNSESTELGSSSTTGQQTATSSITSSSIIGDNHHQSASMIIKDKKQSSSSSSKKQKKNNNNSNNNNNNNVESNNNNNNNANNQQEAPPPPVEMMASFKKGDSQPFYHSTASSSSSSYRINLNHEDHLMGTAKEPLDGVSHDQNGHERRRSLGQFSNSDISSSSDHFEINWTNLSYRIEPKWYKKFNLLDRLFPQQQIVNNHSSSASSSSSSTTASSSHINSDPRQSSDENLKNPPPTRSPLDPIEIFSNLNGTIRSGQLTAVLGPSGAGKTTLLNCLTGKFRNGVTGHINLTGANGKKLKMCTIPQKDHLLDLLTVEENLWFASKIKNPERGFDHAKNIEKVVNLLGLKRCRGAKIKKISGGQHKRVSIAQELLSNPDILVLDEPTSGLDSLTCFKTVSMLRDLVELSANNDYIKPMAIIVTIHQPQPKVFNLFHHVYILANGGRVIFEGGPETALETITNISGIQPNALSSSNGGAGAAGPNASLSNAGMAAAVDPASFLIEIASEEYGLEPIEALSEHQRRLFIANNQYQQYQRRGIPYVQHQERDSYVDSGSGSGGSSTNKSGSTTFNKSVPQFAPEFDHSANSKFRGLSGAMSPPPPHHHQLSYDNSRAADSSKTSYIHNNLYVSEQLQFTNEANHKGKFWSHTATLTHRTLLTIRRDPLLMTSRVLFHLMIPILMAHVYGKATGAANACPHYEPEIDITQIPSLVGSKRIESMLEELHMSIENVSMFFIIMYAFAAAVLALNALSFPLNMQVLLKETRNGWYSMSSFVVAKTIADLPLELTMPTLTMALVYPLTGQPSSYLQWRMMTICLIMTLCSLIAQTQALILGALVMNSIQTAVFVSQASQLPWVILAGFTIRIKRLSEPLKLISLTSFYRLGCEAITLTRYGFGICPCDPQEITGEPVKLVGIPDQMRTLAQYWIESLEASKNAGGAGDNNSNNSTELTTATVTPATAGLVNNKNDIFQHLATQLSYANSYGVNITSCDDVAPDRIRAINLGDNWLVARIWHLIIMLVIMKIFLYYAVQFSIRIRL